jgi:hypothetical protein
MWSRADEIRKVVKLAGVKPECPVAAFHNPVKRTGIQTCEPDDACSLRWLKIADPPKDSRLKFLRDGADPDKG